VDFLGVGLVDLYMLSSIIRALAPKSKNILHKAPLRNRFSLWHWHSSISHGLPSHYPLCRRMEARKCPMSTTCSPLSNVISSAKKKSRGIWRGNACKTSHTHSKHKIKRACVRTQTEEKKHNNNRKQTNWTVKILFGYPRIIFCFSLFYTL